ncbi:MAG: signal transduction histidine kinase/DNA-binding NarL/FixJ family response regulator, partial [Phenylobacterium sp.]
MMFKTSSSTQKHSISGRYPIALLAMVFIICSIAIFSHLRSLNIQLIEATAKHSARQYVEFLTQFRSLYNAEVVQIALKSGLKASHEYHSQANTIPLPATMSMLLSERINFSDTDIKTKIYSPYPYPLREKTGGLQDNFAQQAWQFLSQNKNQPFVSIEEIDGELNARYAVADLMREECIDCHNNHPDSPKRDWKAGDVRGILEVNLSLIPGLEKVDAIFIQVVGLISLLLLVALTSVSFMINHLRRINQKTMLLNNQLSQQVEERKIAEEAAHLAKDEANLANKTKSIFLANISHEIRTPMNAIMGYCQILKRDPALSPDQHHSLHVVGQSSAHLLELINDILDISKIESGVQQMNPVPFDLISLLQGISDMFRLKTQNKGLVWQVELDFFQQEFWVVGDESKLRQILINIIGNAVKFTDQGFVQLTANESTDGIFYFAISDSGLGISTDDQAKLFTPFNQGQAGLKKGGTGLGLAISKKYLELMGSRLELQSTDKVGTSFSFQLAMPYDTSQSHEKVVSHSYKCLANQGTVSVLVVDDIKTNREMLTRILEDARFTVTQATDGYAALALLEQKPFDLVMTDVVMPKMGGIKLLNLAQATSHNRSTPIVAVTACSPEKDKRHFISLGFADYISKPFLIDQLFASIEQTLKVAFEYRDIDAQAADSNQSIKMAWPHDEAIIAGLIQAAE